MLLLCIVEAVAVVVLAKRLLGLKRKQRDKTAGEGGGEAEAGAAAKGEIMNKFLKFFKAIWTIMSQLSEIGAKIRYGLSVFLGGLNCE